MYFAAAIIIYMLIIPLLLGICTGEERGISRCYLTGSMMQLGIFCLCYYLTVLVLRDNTIATLRLVFHIALIPFTAYGVYCRLMRRMASAVRKMRDKVNEVSGSGRIVFLLTAAIMAYQLLRVAVGVPTELSDGQTYDTLVGDMVSSGLIYGRDINSGAALSGIGQMDSRYITTPWYVYEAYIATVTSAHPLIITETVIPVYMLLLSYIVLWTVGGTVFGVTDTRRRLLFMLAGCVITELMTAGNDQSATFLIWPAWGKNIPAAICCPMLAVLYIEAVRELRRIPRRSFGKKARVDSSPYKKEAGATLRYRKRMIHIYLGLLMYSLIACGATAAAMMAIPLEMGVLGLSYSVSERRPGLLVPAVLAAMPAAAQLILYFLISRGVLLGA